MTDQEKEELIKYCQCRTYCFPDRAQTFLEEEDVEGYIAMKKEIWKMEGRIELLKEMLKEQSNS